jgi:hypothetical protein
MTDKERLEKIFRTMRRMDLDEQIQSIMISPDLPPLTPFEQAIDYIEGRIGFKVDDEYNLWQGQFIIGELEGVDILHGKLIVKTKMYHAFTVPLKKGKTHESKKRHAGD